MYGTENTSLILQANLQVPYSLGDVTYSSGFFKSDNDFNLPFPCSLDDDNFKSHTP